MIHLTPTRKLILSLFFGVLILFILAWLGFGYWADNHEMVKFSHRLFSSVCHQNSARSFVISGTQLPVCGRCLGIYTALPISFLLIPVMFPAKKALTKRRMSFLILGVSLFFALEVILEMLDLLHVSNIFRFVTGFAYIILISVLLIKTKHVKDYG